MDADNGGNRATGRQRAGASVSLNDPSGHGDVLSARFIRSFDGLDYGRVADQAQLGRVTVGAAYTRLHYALGETFSTLDAHGTAQIVSLYGSYPLIRSPDANLRVQLAYDAKAFDDRVDATDSITAKRAKSWMASLSGELRDDVLGGGATSEASTLTHGRIEIRTPEALTADAATVRSHGDYTSSR